MTSKKFSFFNSWYWRIIAGLLSTAPARAAVLYDNLSPSTGATSGGFTGGLSLGPLADSFSNGFGASTLSDVKVFISASSPLDGASFAVGLYTDSATSPGALISTLATITDSSLTSSLASYDIPVTGSIPLATNTRYWIELFGANSSARWGGERGDIGVGVANEYNYTAANLYAFPNYGVSPYQATISNSISAVPEPTPLVGLGLASLSLLYRRRGKFKGVEIQRSPESLTS